MSFRLVPGADREEFEDADRGVQTRFQYHQPGLVRRTTARSEDGTWVVITMWRSEADADRSTGCGDQDQTVVRFMALVDAESVERQRYTTLD